MVLYELSLLESSLTAVVSDRVVKGRVALFCISSGVHARR